MALNDSERELLERWAERDALYNAVGRFSGKRLRPELTPAELAAARLWREDEARYIGSAPLADQARSWTP
jgi:hypothetical protein